MIKSSNCKGAIVYIVISSTKLKLKYLNSVKYLLAAALLPTPTRNPFTYLKYVNGLWVVVESRAAVTKNIVHIKRGRLNHKLS